MGGTALPNPIASTALQLKWKETYTSSALARVLHAVFGRGVLRGYNPVPNGGDRQLRLEVDPLLLDSALIFSGIGVHQTLSLFLRETANVDFDLSGIGLGTTVTVAVVVDYAHDQTTTAEWRTYTPAEVTAGDIQTDAATVLCKVTMPGGAGPILDTDIDTTVRDSAWKWQPPAGRGIAPPPLLLDMSFGNKTSTYALFDAPYPSGLTFGIAVDGTAPFGDAVASINGTALTTLTVNLGAFLEVTPGERLTVDIWYRYLVNSAELADLTVAWADEDGSPTVTDSDTLPAGVTTWQRFQKNYIVPTGSRMVRFQLLDNIDWAVGQTLYLNKVHVHAEGRTATAFGDRDTASRQAGIREIFNSLLLGPPGGAEPWRMTPGETTLDMHAPEDIGSGSFNLGTAFIPILMQMYSSLLVGDGTDDQSIENATTAADTTIDETGLQVIHNAGVARITLETSGLDTTIDHTGILLDDGATTIILSSAQIVVTPGAVVTTINNSGIGVVDSGATSTIALTTSGADTTISSTGINLINTGGTARLFINTNAADTTLNETGLSITDTAGTPRIFLNTNAADTTIDNQGILVQNTAGGARIYVNTNAVDTTIDNTGVLVANAVGSAKITISTNLADITLDQLGIVSTNSSGASKIQNLTNGVDTTIDASGILMANISGTNAQYGLVMKTSQSDRVALIDTYNISNTLQQNRAGLYINRRPGLTPFLEAVVHTSWVESTGLWQSTGVAPIKIEMNTVALILYRGPTGGTFADSAWVQVGYFSLASTPQIGDLDAPSFRRATPTVAVTDKTPIMVLGENQASTFGVFRIIMEKEALWITVNAGWNNNTNQWERDDTSARASFGLRFKGDGLLFYFQEASEVDTWGSGAWVDELQLTISSSNLHLISNLKSTKYWRINGTDQDLQIDCGPGILATSDANSTNPDNQTNFTNEVRSKGILKQWGVLDLPTLTTAINPTGILEGLNNSSARWITNTDGRIQIYFGVAFTSADDYVISAIHYNFSGGPTTTQLTHYFPVIIDKATTYFIVALINHAGTTMTLTGTPADGELLYSVHGMHT